MQVTGKGSLCKGHVAPPRKHNRSGLIVWAKGPKKAPSPVRGTSDTVRDIRSKEIGRPSWWTDSNENFDEVKGLRYDASLQRWVRDARVTKLRSDDESLLVTPLSGTPYMVWPVMHTELSKRKLKSVPPQEVEPLVRSGKVVLLDVRSKKDYEAQHAEGAINIPLFQPIAGNGVWDQVKKVVFAVGFAMADRERNPRFREEALELLDPRKKVVVMCNIGGTLIVGVKPWAPGRRSYNDPDRAFGRESRSLKGAYELFQAGFKNVIHLDGGLGAWRTAGYETCSGPNPYADED